MHASRDEDAECATPSRSSASAPRTLDRVAIGTALIALGLLAWRLRYGMDVLDESYYAAGAYRFALGMHPLLDDLGTHQFASYLVAPIVDLWLSMTGGIDGIILVLRAVYLAGSVAAAATAFTFLRRIIDWRIALLASAAAMGLVPLLIFAPSYNTIALLSISVATSLAGIALLDSRRQWLLGISGAMLVIAAIAYPTLALLIVLAVLLVALAARSWKAAALMAGGAAFAAAIFLMVISRDLGGLDDFLAYQRFAAGGVGGLSGPGKAAVIAKGLIGAVYLAPAAWMMSVIVGHRFLHRPAPPLLVAALPAATLLVIHVGAPQGRTVGVASLALLGVITSGLALTDSQHRRTMLFVFAVGTGAGVLMAYTSLAGFTAFGYAAAAVAAPAIAVLLQNSMVAMRARAGDGRAAALAVAIGATVVLGVTGMSWEATYPHGPMPLTQAGRGSGAYAGLIGESNVADQSSDMRSDLARVVDAEDRLLVYASTPSAYILSPATPAAPNLWPSDTDGTDRDKAAFVVAWLETDLHRPTVVLVDRRSWDGRDQGSSDYLLDYIDRTYVPAVTRSEYVILVRR